MLKIKLSKRFLCTVITLALLAGYTFVPMMASAVTEETDTYRYFDYSDQTDGVLTISSSGNINLTEQKATNITESIVVGGRFKVDSAYTGSNFLIPVSGGFNFDINSYRQFVISGSSSQSENVKSQHAITKISKVIWITAIYLGAAQIVCMSLLTAKMSLQLHCIPEHQPDCPRITLELCHLEMVQFMLTIF